jgi:hypothetical protein
MGILNGLTAQPKVWSCRVRDLLAELDDSDKAILIEALADENWKAEALSRALRERGLAISGTPLRAHRNNSCSCRFLSSDA